MRKKRGKARANSSTIVERDGEVASQRHHDEILSIDIPEGPAEIGVTHGVKWWGSTHETGMTVESTCYVKICCQGDTDSLSQASDKASELAYRFAFKNGRKMWEQLENEFKTEAKR